MASAAPLKLRITTYAARYVKTLADEFATRTDRAAEVVRQELRKNLATPGHGVPSAPGEFPRYQSGAMYRGVQTVTKTRSPYTVRIVNRKKYFDWLEGGTVGGRVIVPKNAKALRFNTRKGVVFTKKVKQGAIAARRQGERTLEQCRAKIRAIYTRGIRDMLKGNRAVVRVS